MKNYKQIIAQIVGKPLDDKENRHPNVPAGVQEQLRKVNFRLQQEKDEMLQQLLLLRQGYLKMQKRSETNEKKRKSAEGQLEQIKTKLQRTQALKTKMQQRLYNGSTTTANSTKRSFKTNSQQPNSNILMPQTQRPSEKQSVNQWTQTQQLERYTMSVQTGSDRDYQTVAQLDLLKKKVTELEQVIEMQNKVITDLQLTANGTLRSCRTDRYVGRIMKSRKKLNDGTNK